MNKPIATMARTNEILEKYDLYAKKNFGQNFIIEPGIVEKIARLSKADENSAVAWIPIADLPKVVSEARMLPVYEKLIARSRQWKAEALREKGLR